MTINNAHPLFIEELRKQIPAGATVRSISSETPTTSIAVISENGLVYRKRMKKVDVSVLLKSSVKTIEVEEGDLLEDVCRDFCDKYNLLILPNIDFELPEGAVNFAGRTEIVHTFTALPDCVSLYGNMTVTLINKNRVSRDAGVLSLSLNTIRLKLALVAKPHKPPTGRLFSGNKLTNRFSAYLHDLLTMIELDELSLEDISTSTIVHDTSDRVSRLCFFKTVDERVFPLRYVSPSNELPDLS